jgi:NAD dependent epimerase/dehydratase
MVSRMRPRRCLVTGAAGFIGSHLVERLVGEGVRVRALVHYTSRGGFGNLDLLPGEVRDSVEIVAGEITDPEFVDAAVAGCDTVLHLAAIISIPYSYAAPRHCLEVNVGGTTNVMESCRRHGVGRLVHTSTSEVYGSARSVPMSESHPRSGQSPYAASKIAADAMAEAMQRSFGLPVVVVRPFNTYGPRQSTRAVIPSIVSQLVLGADRIELGDLRPTRDFVHVSDTVAGFVAAATRDGVEGREFNLATGNDISIGDLASMAMKVVGREVPVVCDDARRRPADSEVVRLCGDASVARDVLEWEPRIALEQGLESVAEFVRRHPDRFRPKEQIS